MIEAKKSRNLTAPEKITRSRGRYYTNLFNPFTLKSFLTWQPISVLKRHVVLEPFAGANNLIRNLREIEFAKEFVSFDILPHHADVRKRDTLLHFPQGYEVCITNPPWLYKSRAKRQRIPFPCTHYEDVYQYALELCLKYCRYVVALLPASFLNSGLFRERLSRYILLHKKLFSHTDNPVCMALFSPEACADVEIFYDEEYVGNLQDLEAHIPKDTTPYLRMNDNEGTLGFIGIDGTQKESMCFCDGDELGRKYTISHTSRSITRISGVQVSNERIHELNRYLTDFRKKTQDVSLTPFKGLRKDGKYRRRMDFRLLRSIISYVVK